jgi:predicted secreted Zn-dependent protease
VPDRYAAEAEWPAQQEVSTYEVTGSDR